MSEKKNRYQAIAQTAPGLFPSGVGDSVLQKAFDSNIIGKELKEAGVTNVPQAVRILPMPYSKKTIMQLMNVDVHHMRCLAAKVAATTGLGFMTDEEVQRKDRERRLQDMAQMALNEPDSPALAKASEDLLKELVDPSRKRAKADEILDPLCQFTFQDLLSSANWDLEHGDGYIEVKRDQNDKIVGLHRLHADSVWVVVDTGTGGFHYMVRANAGATGTNTRHFCQFGKKDAFMLKIKEKDFGSNMQDVASFLGLSFGVSGKDPKREDISEVIHFRGPNAFSNYYGYADWFPAVPQLELSKAVTRHKFDYYYNRGVVEFLVSVIGTKIDDDDWNEFVDKLNSNQGTANKRKSGAINLRDELAKVDVHKLGAEVDSATFKEDSETIASKVVTAHGVPPVLANLQIPGKIGAANETVSALLAFQLLTIGQRQRHIERTLAATLGSKEAGLNLTEDNFVLRRITDLMNMENADTASRMRTELPVAQAQGRKVEDGLKD